LRIPLNVLDDLGERTPVIDERYETVAPPVSRASIREREHREYEKHHPSKLACRMPAARWR